MAMRYFMIFGSPGSYQVGGPNRRGHHSGWIEVEHLSWDEGGAANGRAVHNLTVWLREGAVSPPMLLHARASETFDLVVVDTWDDSAQKSQSKAELRSVMVMSVLRQYPDEGPPVDMFVLDYVSSKVSPGAATKTAGIGSAATKMALASVPRRAPTVARA